MWHKFEFFFVIKNIFYQNYFCQNLSTYKKDGLDTLKIYSSYLIYIAFRIKFESLQEPGKIAMYNLIRTYF